MLLFLPACLPLSSLSLSLLLGPTTNRTDMLLVGPQSNSRSIRSSAFDISVLLQPPPPPPPSISLTTVHFTACTPRPAVCIQSPLPFSPSTSSKSIQEGEQYTISQFLGNGLQLDMVAYFCKNAPARENRRAEQLRCLVGLSSKPHRNDGWHYSQSFIYVFLIFPCIFLQFRDSRSGFNCYETLHLRIGPK